MTLVSALSLSLTLSAESFHSQFGSFHIHMYVFQKHFSLNVFSHCVLFFGVCAMISKMEWNGIMEKAQATTE